MPTSQLITYAFEFIGAIAIVSYGYGQFRKGKNDSKLDTIKLFQAQVSALDTKVTQQDDEIKKLRDEIKSLHEAIDDKDKKLSETLAILQGRDPQTAEFVKALNEYILIGRPIMDAIQTRVLPTVEKLDKFLNKQTF